MAHSATRPRVGRGLFFLEKARELLLEARQAATAVEQLLLAAGPGRVRFRVDIEMDRITLSPIGAAGGEFAPVGHDDLDGMIAGMDIGLHVFNGADARSWLPNCIGLRLYIVRRPVRQPGGSRWRRL